MKKQELNQINGVEFYIHTDDFKYYADYATQIVYLHSDCIIVKLNFYIGQLHNFVNWIEVYEKTFGRLLYSRYDIHGARINRNIDMFLINEFKAMHQKFVDSAHGLYSSEKLNKILAQNLEQLLSNDYQKANFEAIKKFFDDVI